jgi:hypothetical protein
MILPMLHIKCARVLDLASHCMWKSIQTARQDADARIRSTVNRHDNSRIVEVFAFMQTVVAAFFANLNVEFSLTIDRWSNRYLKGFWMVTAHWIYTSSGESRSVLLTILDVVCGIGIGNRVGEDLFTHLKSKWHPFMDKLLNVVIDNGSDAISAFETLFCLVNTFVGNKQMLWANQVRRANNYV